MSAICGTSRGRYGKPIPIRNIPIKWVDEDSGGLIKQPTKYRCEHENHWKWGKGTRNGQKLYYPTKEMYCQKWELTKKEMKEAVEMYDMFSLDMPLQIICKHCAEHETPPFITPTLPTEIC